MDGGAAILISDTSSSTLQEVIVTPQSADKDQQSLIVPDDDQNMNKGASCWLKWLFSVIVISNYMILIFALIMKTKSAVHLLTWFFTVTTTTYVLLVMHTLLFTKQLCYHTVEYDLMRGSSSNYLPKQINVHHQVPYETICHIAHIRGTTINKWHSTLVGYGGVTMLNAAIIKIFDGYTGAVVYNVQERAALILWVLAIFGGLLAVNFEIYVSPSFSKRWNCMAHAIHLYGGATYGLFGTLAYAVYCGFNFFSSLMIFCSLLLCVLWKTAKMYQDKKRIAMFADEEQENAEWVHFMSQINVGIEVAGLFPSALGLILLGYQMQ